MCVPKLIGIPPPNLPVSESITVTLWEGVESDAPLLLAYMSLPEDGEKVRRQVPRSTRKQAKDAAPPGPSDEFSKWDGILGRRPTRRNT